MQKLNIATLLFTVLMCLQSWYVSAAVSADKLYQTSISVQSRSDNERARAARDGLFEVLQKVSGNDAAVSHPKVIAAAQKAEDYVSAFSYISTDDGTALKLKYDRRAVQDLLTQSGVSVLGNDRPALLVWTAVEEFGGVRRILEEGDSHPLAKAIAMAASERGIPVVFPKIDDADRVALPIQDLWGLFEDSIVTASQRYNAPAILAGRAYPDGQTWSGQWLFLINGDEDRFADNRKEAQMFAARAVERASKKMVTGYGVSSVVSGGMISLQVQGVSSVSAYATVTQYLQKLDIIRHASIIRASGGVITYQLETASVLQQVKQAIESDSRFELTPPPVDGQPAQLYYQWRG